MLLSCQKYDEVAELPDTLSTINALPDIDQQKYFYFSLSEEEQKGVWIAKLNDVLQSDYGNENQREWIIKSINWVDSQDNLLSKNSGIKELQSKLLNAFEIKDYVGIFCTLHPFDPLLNFDVDCQPCLEEMQKANPTQDITITARARSCNCKWTCGFNQLAFGGEVSGRCTVTSQGCGLFLAFECRRRFDIY